MDQDPKMASKPQQVKEKIVMGKMNKFYEENCLLQQEFVKDNSKMCIRDRGKIRLKPLQSGDNSGIISRHFARGRTLPHVVPVPGLGGGVETPGGK